MKMASLPLLAVLVLSQIQDLHNKGGGADTVTNTTPTPDSADTNQ